MSYLFTAFLSTAEPRAAREAEAYLLEGELFELDRSPELEIVEATDGSFQRMELRYDRERRPIVLRRLRGEDLEAARGEVVDLASLCGCEEIENAVKQSELGLEWDPCRCGR